MLEKISAQQYSWTKQALTQWEYFASSPTPPTQSAPGYKAYTSIADRERAERLRKAQLELDRYWEEGRPRRERKQRAADQQQRFYDKQHFATRKLQRAEIHQKHVLKRKNKQIRRAAATQQQQKWKLKHALRLKCTLKIHHRQWICWRENTVQPITMERLAQQASDYFHQPISASTCALWIRIKNPLVGMNFSFGSRYAPTPSVCHNTTNVLPATPKRTREDEVPSQSSAVSTAVAVCHNTTNVLATTPRRPREDEFPCSLSLSSQSAVSTAVAVCHTTTNVLPSSPIHTHEDEFPCSLSMPSQSAESTAVHIPTPMSRLPGTLVLARCRSPLSPSFVFNLLTRS